MSRWRSKTLPRTRGTGKTGFQEAQPAAGAWPPDRHLHNQLGLSTGGESHTPRTEGHTFFCFLSPNPTYKSVRLLHCLSRLDSLLLSWEMMHFFCPAGRRERAGAGGSWQRTFRPLRKLAHGVPLLTPDMQTAEGGKENSMKAKGIAKAYRQELVSHVAHSKSMAADPHFVKEVRRHWLCNHILESHLRRQGSEILNCHQPASPGTRYSRKGRVTGMPHPSLRLTRCEHRNLVKIPGYTQAASWQNLGPQTLRGWPSNENAWELGSGWVEGHPHPRPWQGVLGRPQTQGRARPWATWNAEWACGDLGRCLGPRTCRGLRNRRCCGGCRSRRPWRAGHPPSRSQPPSRRLVSGGCSRAGAPRLQARGFPFRRPGPARYAARAARAAAASAAGSCYARPARPLRSPRPGEGRGPNAAG